MVLGVPIFKHFRVSSGKVLTANFSNKDLDVIDFVKRFQNFIDGISTECLNIMLDRKRLLL